MQFLKVIQTINSCKYILWAHSEQLKIRNSALPHTLECPSTFNCWYCRCWMWWWYTLILSLSISFPWLSNLFLFTCVTDDDIYEFKTIACKVATAVKTGIKEIDIQRAGNRKHKTNAFKFKELISHLWNNTLNSRRQVFW